MSESWSRASTDVLYPPNGSEAPESTHETARLVDRDVSDVHSDLTQLNVLGIFSFETDGPSGAINLSSHSIGSKFTTRSTIAATPITPSRVRSGRIHFQCPY
jgi:hypothetical protein